MRKILCSVFVFCLVSMGSFGQEATPFDKAVEESASIDELLLQKAVKLFVASISGIQKPEGDPTQQDINNVTELFIHARGVMAYLEMNQYRQPASFKRYVPLILPLFAEAKTRTSWIDDLLKNEGNHLLLLSRREVLRIGVEVNKGYIIPARPSTEYKEISEITEEKKR